MKSSRGVFKKSTLYETSIQDFYTSILDKSTICVNHTPHTYQIKGKYSI